MPQTLDFDNFAMIDGSSKRDISLAFSSTKVDAQSVINWTVVGQLSWQYFRAPTLDRCSLSQWSSSSVCNTVPSREFITNSWSVFPLNSTLFIACVSFISTNLFYWTSINEEDWDSVLTGAWFSVRSCDYDEQISRMPLQRSRENSSDCLLQKYDRNRHSRFAALPQISRHLVR